jgi:hypothetical protein
VIGNQLEAAAEAEASAAAKLWRDLPSSDYSEILREQDGATGGGKKKKSGTEELSRRGGDV